MSSFGSTADDKSKTAGHAGKLTKAAAHARLAQLEAELSDLDLAAYQLVFGLAYGASAEISDLSQEINQIMSRLQEEIDWLKGEIARLEKAEVTANRPTPDTPIIE